MSRGGTFAVGVIAMLSGATTGCSTTVVGRLASATGSVMASHSNDGDGGGFYSSYLRRVVKHDWPAGATRDVKGHPIPQVRHTYAYHTEGYAAMNEHQVGLAESTVGAQGFGDTFLSCCSKGACGSTRSRSRSAPALSSTARGPSVGRSDPLPPPAHIIRPARSAPVDSGPRLAHAVQASWTSCSSDSSHSNGPTAQERPCL